MEILLRQVVVSDEAQKTASLEVIRKEFYPDEISEAFVARNQKFTLYDSNSFLNNTEDKSFGGDMFTITDETGIVGVSQIKYYKYDLIRPQLYFFPKFEEDGKTIASIYLSQLGKEIGKPNAEVKIEIVAELAYYWVKPEVRGKGFGKELFNKPLDVFVEKKDTVSSFLFTIAMGNAAGQEHGKKLLNFMLEREGEINGKDENQKTKVTGVEVPWNEIEQLGLNPNMFDVRKESEATRILAIKYGMKFYGYSKNLSPVFGVVK
ncbi:MAG: GNAT family N-acetyltransferase [Candidatus Woesearchaeota archaeon]|jgi:GNAT superfamily N-acetyltransferase